MSRRSGRRRLPRPFLIVASLLALIWVDRGSAEFVVLVLTIIIGLGMLGVVALLAAWARAFPTPPTAATKTKRNALAEKD